MATISELQFKKDLEQLPEEQREAYVNYLTEQGVTIKLAPPKPSERDETFEEPEQQIQEPSFFAEHPVTKTLQTLYKPIEFVGKKAEQYIAPVVGEQVRQTVKPLVQVGTEIASRAMQLPRMVIEGDKYRPEDKPQALRFLEEAPESFARASVKPATEELAAMATGTLLAKGIKSGASLIKNVTDSVTDVFKATPKKFVAEPFKAMKFKGKLPAEPIKQVEKLQEMQPVFRQAADDFLTKINTEFGQNLAEISRETGKNVDLTGVVESFLKKAKTKTGVVNQKKLDKIFNDIPILKQFATEYFDESLKSFKAIDMPLDEAYNFLKSVKKNIPSSVLNAWNKGIRAEVPQEFKGVLDFASKITKQMDNTYGDALKLARADYAPKIRAFKVINKKLTNTGIDSFINTTSKKPGWQKILKKVFSDDVLNEFKEYRNLTDEMKEIEKAIKGFPKSRRDFILKQREASRKFFSKREAAKIKFDKEEAQRILNAKKKFKKELKKQLLKGFALTASGTIAYKVLK